MPHFKYTSRMNRFLVAFLILTIDFSQIEMVRVKKRLDDIKGSDDKQFRPTKWVANSAMDVWYGNSSLVEVFSKEILDIFGKIAERKGAYISIATILSYNNFNLI